MSELKPEAEQKQESMILGVSGRGWITFFIVYTVCFMAAKEIEAPQILEHALSTTLGFWFGQRGKS